MNIRVPIVREQIRFDTTRRTSAVVRVAAAVLLLIACGARAERDVFNDDRPETGALEIWRITRDRDVTHHSVYHNTDPFSHDGRYILYTITPWAVEPGEDAAPSTFAVYDLMLDREVWRCPGGARWPIWAHRGNRVFWADGRKGRRQNVWQVEIPSGAVTKICDDARNCVTGLSPDDGWLFYTYNKVFRVRTEPGSVSEVAWAHPEAPAVSSSLVCHNPTKPVYQVRQNARMLRNRPHRWSKKYPARMLVTDDGRMLGPALASIEQSHGAWLGNGEYLISGDGLLRGRRWDQPYPVPLLTYSNTSSHDPSPCGRSGQWTCTTDGINDTLKVFDWRTTDTTVVCYSCSIVHQPAGDARDRSGPYDSDAHGSPDGTKIFFSTNYQIDAFPATLITGSPGDGTLEVLSTKGFPDHGFLSVHVGVVAYSGKTDTAFFGIEPGALGSRVGPTPPGFTASNFHGRTDAEADDPLAAQFATDVYLAVVRLPDPPALAARGEDVVLYPGRNHREISGYRFYVDGRPVAGEPWTGAEPFACPPGEELRAAAVEWSGLTSARTAALELNGRPCTVRFEPQRPAWLDAPVKALFALNKDGAKRLAPADATHRTLPRALAVYSTRGGLPWARETWENGRLTRREELTPDGRATLVVDYADGAPRVRTVRDPTGHVKRIEHLDARGYLTKVEDYSRGRLVCVTDYRDGRPARQRRLGGATPTVWDNPDGFWTPVEAPVDPEGQGR